MVIIFVILGSSNSNRQDYDGYHEDPYYYYPNHPAPRHGVPHHPAYYPHPYPSHYPQPYYPPYPQPYQQPYQQPSVQPEPTGLSTAFGIALFMAVAIGAFTLAANMGLFSAVITVGPQQQKTIYEQPEGKPLPASLRIEGDYQKYSKDSPRR